MSTEHNPYTLLFLTLPFFYKVLALSISHVNVNLNITSRHLKSRDQCEPGSRIFPEKCGHLLCINIIFPFCVWSLKLIINA